MDTSAAPSYRGYRFPAEIISQCVWLYFRFCLSFRDVQEMMLERGVVVSHEAVRLWCLKFGAEYARRFRHRGDRPGDTWFLDEVFCKINGQLVHLWRAVDQEGEVLDILVQSKRNARAAKRFFKKLVVGEFAFTPLSAFGRDRGNVAANRTDPVKRAAVPACQISQRACAH